MNTLLNAIDKDKAIVSQRRAKAVAIKIITHVLSLRYLSTDEIVERLEKLIMWQHGTIAYNLGNSAALTFSTWQVRVIFDLIEQMLRPEKASATRQEFRKTMHECIKKYKIIENCHMGSGQMKAG